MEVAAFRHYNRETDEVQYDIPKDLARRPPTFNSSGKGVIIGINSYPITTFPGQTVFQYDVSHSNSIIGDPTTTTLDLCQCIKDYHTDYNV